MERLINRFAVMLAGIVLAFPAFPDTTPGRFAQFILTPQFEAGTGEVMSLESDTRIETGGTSLWLDEYETGVLPGEALYQGSVLSANGPFVLTSDLVSTNLPVPDSFAGDAFSIPLYGGSHTYFIRSPFRDTRVEYASGGNLEKVDVFQGEVLEIDGGRNHSQAESITSTGQILVTHQGAGATGDPLASHPVPPVDTELWGLQSGRIALSALEDDTLAVVYSSDGDVTHYLLDAREQIWLKTGPGISQDGPRGVHILANGPIAAIQVEDPTSSVAAFWRTQDLRQTYGFPIATQQILVACPAGNTSVTLYEDPLSPETVPCEAQGPFPGLVVFAAGDDPDGIAPGTYLQADQPVHVLYRAHATGELRNLIGAGEADTKVSASTRSGAMPSLDAPVSPTNDNPYSITGSADPMDTIFVYVNGAHQQTAVAGADGSFAAAVALLDGINTAYATSWDGVSESGASNSISIEYVNRVPRVQGGTISQDTVWTAGTDGPYRITSDLVVAPGIQLLLQPGAELHFDNGILLQVDGTLLVQGTAAAPVQLTSAAASPQKGDWSGIRIRAGSTGTLIEHALIEWAGYAVWATDVQVRVNNSAIRNLVYGGIFMEEGASGGIEGNLIESSGTYGIYLDAS